MAAATLLLFLDDALTCVSRNHYSISPKVNRNPNFRSRLNCEACVYLLLSLLPLRGLRILVLHGEIGDGAAASAAVSGARVGIGLRQLSLHLRRVRVRALAGEDGEPGGAFDQRGVGGEGEVGGGGGCGGGEGR